MERREIFVAGGTGYLGKALLPLLVERGHRVLALARSSSAAKVPAGCEVVPGDALDASTYAARVPRNATFLHLVGVSHPAPWKADLFEKVDAASIRATLAAVAQANAAHLVYLSVAQPAPVMRAYIDVRSRCEAA